MLPTQKSKSETSLSKYSILLYGQEKIGKTSFASNFPKPIFLLFEPGAKDLEIYKEDIKDWHHFRKVLKELEVDKSFQNVVFDTADVAYNMIEKYVCEANGVSDPGELEYGKGWRKIRQEVNASITRLLKTGKGVVFTSHATEKEFKRRDGGSTDRIVPTMAKQMREILEPVVDIWCYYRYTQSGGREFVIRGNEEIAAGHRLENHFHGIDKISGGKNSKEAYENFLAGFNNTLEVKKKVVPLGFKTIKNGGTK